MTSAVTATVQSSKLMQAFYLCGATAGTQYLKVAATVGVIVYHVFVGEYAGIATSSCLDKSSFASGATATTFTAGSIGAMTQAGDLLIMDGCAAGTPARTSFTVGSQASITWNKRGDDILDGCMEQYGVYSVTTAFTPQFTTSPTSTFLGTAMAFTPNVRGGTLPVGMYPIYTAAYNTPAAAGATQAVEFPSTGNLLTSMQNCGGLDVTSVTDGTNTWTKPGPGSSAFSGSALVYANSVYAANAAPNTGGAITFNLTGSVDCTFMMTDWSGAATVPFVQRLIQNGDQTVPATTLPFVTNFLPGMTDGWVLGANSQNVNTSVQVTSPTGALFIASTFGGQNENGPSLPDQNNFWGIFHNSSNTATNWTAGQITSDAALFWGAEVDAFLSATGSYSGISIIQSPSALVTTGTTVTVTTAATQAGSALVAVIGNVSSTSTVRTVTKVCTDGVTCGAGNSFTQAVAGSGAACTIAATPAQAGDVWYLFGHAAGVTSVEVTVSGAITQGEMKVYEVRNISAIDTSNHINSGTGVSSIDTGASVTTTGSQDLIVSMLAVQNAILVNPAPNNAFGYDNIIFGNTKDSAGALIAAAGTYSYAALDGGATDTFCNATAAFK